MHGFNTWQLKEVSVIVSNRYSLEQQLNIQEQINAYQDSVIAKQKTQIIAAKAIADNNLAMYHGALVVTESFKSTLNKSQQENKKLKKHRVLCVIGMAILGALAIAT